MTNNERRQHDSRHLLSCSPQVNTVFVACFRDDGVPVGDSKPARLGRLGSSLYPHAHHGGNEDESVE